ncbi:MAG: hypothetical protein ACRD0W_00240 [Acidimicrobiales bacterium]
MPATFRFLGCDLVTGRIVEELPDLTPSGPLSALLGAYTSAAFTLPLAADGTHGSPPRNWEGATEPGRSMIVAVRDTVVLPTATGQVVLPPRPVWAGVVLKRRRGAAAAAELGCVSLEGYFDRRYVADHAYTGQDEAAVILAGLFADADTVEGVDFVLDAPATGTPRDRQYFDKDDKTVYSAMRELMGVDGGPEWTVALDWADATQTVVQKTLYVRKRIGIVSAAPTAVFTTGSAPGVFASAGASETRYTLDESYESGKGANHVLATSSGEGDTRPQSTPARDEALFAAGWPRYEHRFTPSTSITDIATLNSHAAAALALMARGSRILTLVGRADAYPVLGADWGIGDDIGYDLIGPGHPTGLQGVNRAVGWELDTAAGTAAPILLVPGQEVV